MKRIENILALVSFLAVLLMVWFPENFLLMLARSLAFQCMMVLIGLAIWLAFRKRWRIISFPVVGVVLLYAMVGGTLTQQTPYDPLATGTRVAHFNVLKYAVEHDSVVQQALQVDADIISFQEVDAAWAQSLVKGLAERYPYRIIESREHPYGLAVFSKYPFLEHQTLLIEDIPNLVGTVAIENTPVHFVASHLKAPMSGAKFRRRQAHSRQLAEYVQSLDGPTFVMGDFNTVPWDVEMQAFVRRTELHDSRRGLSATYPSTLPLAAIPIDYIFHSSDIDCAHFEVLSATSSDHLGIVGTFRLPEMRIAEHPSENIPSQTNP